MSERMPENGMLCPRCRVEYRPGFTQCADCHVPLVEASPMPVAELPRAIRSAGQAATTLRWSAIPIALWLTSLVAYLFVGADHAPGQHPRLSPFVLLIPAVALVVILGILLAAKDLRAHGRKRLRAEFERLLPSAAAEILLPIYRNESGDTARIAGDLLRDLRITSAVAPATPPEGRGSEGATVEQAG